MLFLLKLVALLGALFFVAGSLDNVLGGCDKSVKAQLDPQQCQLAFQRLPRKGGFIIFDSASQTRECGNCLIELRAPSGGTIKNPIPSVQQGLQNIFQRCPGGLGYVWLSELDKLGTTAQLFTDISTTSTQC